MAWWLDILQILFPDLVNKGTRLGFIIYLFKDKEIGWERLSDLPKVTQLVCKVAGLRVMPKTVTLQTPPLLSWASRRLETEHRCFASSFTHQPLTNLAVSGIGVGVENKAAESWEGSSRRRGVVPHFPTVWWEKSDPSTSWPHQPYSWLMMAGTLLHPFWNTF